MLLMIDYSGPEYKGLYEEILLDYHYRFPKWHPIPYMNDAQTTAKKLLNKRIKS